MTADPAPLLIADGLVRTFGGLAAVNDVSFTLGRATVTGLIGANGAGKSTLLNLVSGTLRTERGRIRIDDRDVSRWSANRRANFGLARTFQHPRLAANLTCFENVMLGATLRTAGWHDLMGPLIWPADEKRATRKAAAALEWAGMEREKWTRLPHEVSPQDWLWLEMARGVASEPRLLLLDEPSAGFTARDTSRLAQLVTSLATGGVSVLIVTHDVTLAMRVSASMLVMHLGKLIATGAPSDMVADAGVVSAYLGRKGQAAAASALESQSIRPHSGTVTS